MSKVYYDRMASGNGSSGKYIGPGLNGTERITIVDIFNILVQKVRDTGIHLKVLILMLILVLILVLKKQEPKR